MISVLNFSDNDVIDVLLFQGHLHWQSLELLAFQQWKNIYFIKNSYPSYRSAGRSVNNFFVSYHGQFNNTDLNTKVKSTLYPKAYMKTCAAMILYNIVEPEWITVDCDEPLGHGTFCVFTRENIFKTSPSISSSEFRINDRRCVMRNLVCYLSMWKKVFNVKVIIDNDDIYFTNFSSVEKFQFSFDAIRIKFLPIFIDHAKWTVTCERFVNVYTCKRHYVYNNSTEAYAIYKQRSKNHFAIYSTVAVTCLFQLILFVMKELTVLVEIQQMN